MLPDDPKISWPPLTPYSADHAVWSAWYSGAIVELAAAGALGPAAAAFFNPPTTGELPERMSRGFWHRHATVVPGMPMPQPIHMPFAADVAAISADLLFGETPDLTVDDEPTQQRIEALVDESELQNTLLEGAESCAALGGVYFRVVWDTAVRDVPFLNVMQADQAVPEFAWGQLRAVTFWRELASLRKQQVCRHLERHEPGYILNGLYFGTVSELGDQTPLENHPETKGLPDVVPLPAGLEDRIVAWYVPNVRPHRRLRSGVQGRADIAGCEGELDALDETYSSLMRDIRIGQSRIVVPRQSMSPARSGAGRGAGRTFDLDRAVFTELEVDPDKAGVTHIQALIRTTEHLDTALHLIERIAATAGYSPQTFGLHIQGSAESGTALRIREGRTAITVERKRRYFGPVLRQALGAMLLVDRVVFGRPSKDETPQLDWPQAAASPIEVAQTIETLARAEAVSTETMVKMLHPEWGEEEIQSEVRRIVGGAGRFVQPPDVLTLPDETLPNEQPVQEAA